MNHSERSRTQVKPKFFRLKRLFEKRQTPREWFTTADADGNVQVHPAA